MKYYALSQTEDSGSPIGLIDADLKGSDSTLEKYLYNFNGNGNSPWYSRKEGDISPVFFKNHVSKYQR